MNKRASQWRVAKMTAAFDQALVRQQAKETRMATTTATFWQIFEGAQALSRRGMQHVCPDSHSTCVYCACLATLSAAGMALLNNTGGKDASDERV